MSTQYDVPTALERLGFHSGRDPHIDDPRWTNGFLSSLRPYRGIKLVEKNFHDIVACLRILIEVFQQKTISKNLVNDMACIITFGRAWGCHPDGMLKSNNLISDKDASHLDEMINDISYIWTMILDDMEDTAFHDYDRLYGDI